MENFVTRFNKVLDLSGGSAYQLAKDIGTSEAVISNIKAGKTKPSFDFLDKLLNKYKALNVNWLITGEGLMSLEHQNLNESEPIYAVSNLRKLKTDRKRELQSVPLYDLKATAGIVDLFDETNRSKYIPISYITIPNLPKCDGAIPITGDSMYPLLKSGDMVLYREVHDKKNIIWGEMYLVAISHLGDDFFFAKYIQKSEQDGWVKLVSQNANHQPVEFPIDSIRALALIKASIRINTQF